jgi:hypothetical protein
MLFDIGLDARGVAATSDWKVDSILLRSALRNLRGICTHPQVRVFSCILMSVLFIDFLCRSANFKGETMYTNRLRSRLWMRFFRYVYPRLFF